MSELLFGIIECLHKLLRFLLQTSNFPLNLYTSSNILLVKCLDNLLYLHQVRFLCLQPPPCNHPTLMYHGSLKRYSAASSSPESHCTNCYKNIIFWVVYIVVTSWISKINIKKQFIIVKNKDTIECIPSPLKHFKWSRLLKGLHNVPSMKPMHPLKPYTLSNISSRLGQCISSTYKLLITVQMNNASSLITLFDQFQVVGSYTTVFSCLIYKMKLTRCCWLLSLNGWPNPNLSAHK